MLLVWLLLAATSWERSF